MTNTNPKTGTITVLAFTSDENSITLYTDTGDTLILKNNEYRTLDVVNQILPIIKLGKTAKVVLHDYTMQEKFETAMTSAHTQPNQGNKQSRLARFFKVAKNLVDVIFNNAPTPDVTKQVNHDQITKQVIAQGNPDFDTPLQEDETIVAVVEIEVPKEPEQPLTLTQEQRQLADTITQGIITQTPATPQPTPSRTQSRVIPGMENLRPQMQHIANGGGSPIGMQRFLERVGAVIKQRNHSVQDLLRFMEKGDLPIAEDGCVVAYKRLRSANKDRFKDDHSGKVNQGIGSYVFMNPTLVDPRRNQDCSYGLHIGRRDYMGSFRGDVIVVCKIPPENFIAVPHGDPRKVRVSGYHIVAKLSPEAATLLCSNQSMTTHVATAQILAAIIAGKHVPIIEHVELMDSSANKVVITPIGETPVSLEPQVSERRETSIPMEGEQSNQGQTHPDLTPKSIREAVQAVETTSTEKPKTKAQQARDIFNLWDSTKDGNNLDALYMFKKQAKKSWRDLGFEWDEETEIMNALEARKSEQQQQPKTEEPKVETTETTVDTETHPDIPHIPNAATEVALKEAEEMPRVDPLKLTIAEEAERLYDLWKIIGDDQDLRALYAHKRKAKKPFMTWFTNEQDEEIQDAINKLPKE